jgi:hypothetical protein
MKAMVAAASAAFGAAFAIATAIAPAVAHADEVEIKPNKYATLGACRDDGPHVHLAHNDASYPYWTCKKGTDGYWHIYNSTDPYR